MGNALTVLDLRSINFLSIIVRLLLAALISGIIGLERESIQKPAGTRTYMLICIGSALAMLTNQYIADFVFPGVDPARMGAQVLSGIGFLGAGTIIVVGKWKVSGLTTAAGLWASAAVGLACGIGFYEGAIIGGILLFVVIALLHRVDRIIKNKITALNVCIELENISILKNFVETLESWGMKTYNLSLERVKGIASIYVTLTIKFPNEYDKPSALEKLLEIDGVNYVQDLR